MVHEEFIYSNEGVELSTNQASYRSQNKDDVYENIITIQTHDQPIYADLTIHVNAEPAAVRSDAETDIYNYIEKEEKQPRVCRATPSEVVYSAVQPIVASPSAEAVAVDIYSTVDKSKKTTRK